MARARKRIDPLKVEWSPHAKSRKRDRWPAEWREFWSDCVKHYKAGKLPNVECHNHFVRFVAHVAESEFKGLELPGPCTLVRYLKDDLKA